MYFRMSQGFFKLQQPVKALDCQNALYSRHVHSHFHRKHEMPKLRKAWFRIVYAGFATSCYFVQEKTQVSI